MKSKSVLDLPPNRPMPSNPTFRYRSKNFAKKKNVVHYFFSFKHAIIIFRFALRKKKKKKVDLIITMNFISNSIFYYDS